MNPTTILIPARGLSTKEFAALVRVSTGCALAWIRSGDLRALNLGSTKSGKPRYVILPEFVVEFVGRHEVRQDARPARRQRRAVKDYYPDES